MYSKNSIILRPILSEKSTMLSDTLNKYVFQVDKKANKMEIKDSIEKKFDVRIKKVSTMNFKGKNKNVTIKSSGHVLRTSGNRSSWKKAIVTLEEGFKIDMVGGDV
jgi:large subunit ribosomal protein L23